MLQQADYYQLDYGHGGHARNTSLALVPISGSIVEATTEDTLTLYSTSRVLTLVFLRLQKCCSLRQSLIPTANRGRLSKIRIRVRVRPRHNLGLKMIKLLPLPLIFERIALKLRSATVFAAHAVAPASERDEGIW